MNSLGSGESRLETVISYLLITGVLISLALEVAGLALFLVSYASVDISLPDQQMYIHGKNFFLFLYDQFNGGSLSNGVRLITLGIATLILTPYLRVVASAAYFAWRKDAKYVVITGLVLVILTVSLLLH